MIDNSNLISPNFQNNQALQSDLNIMKLQQNLIMMGFDIIMINKIIFIFKITTENQALDYLIKSEDGMWNHPFIPKEINAEEINNGILEQPKQMMNNVLTKINSLGISNPMNPKNSNNIQNNEINTEEFIFNEDICEICGDSKEFHTIKEFYGENINNNNQIILDNEDINNNNSLYEDENNALINNNNNMQNINNNNQNIKEEEEEEENLNPNECLICMGDLENPVEIEKCKHKFCQECFNSYLVNLINHNRIDQIPCPKNKCSNKELSEEFFSQFLTEQEYFKFRQFKAQNEIARDSKKIFCPLCDSYASIDGITEKYDSNNPNYQKSTLKCQKGHEFCSCGRPLHENECYHDEKEFVEFLSSEQIKKCPKCGFLIKKNRGCNHMTCGNPICRYEFCWLCMKEAVPNHFDYGPCAGKQFFDPDSFSYRLQQSHPHLYCIYSLFCCIFILIILIISVLVAPGLGLTIIAYDIVIENDTFNQQFNKKYLKYVMFIMCAYQSFCIQSIIYIAWAIVFAALAIVIAILVISIVISLLKCIFSIFCGCFFDEEENAEIDVGENDNELGNNININDNNENKENDDNKKM